MENEEKFSDDATEHFRIENEILKIKLKAKYGDAFQSGSTGELPPEIENQFLKNIIAFDEAGENTEYVTVYEKLGKPDYQPADELPEAATAEALENLMRLMEQQDISLEFCDGPYEDAVIYRFITEELFAEEIEKEPIFGSGWNYIYEEFHPNDKAEITRNAHEFIGHWMRKEFDEYSMELARDFVLSDGRIMNKKEGIKKLNTFFESFTGFKDHGYIIDNVSFELHEDERGFGFAEGMIKYDAVMESGEIIHYNGPYKFYMQRENRYWSIFYFVMPGFIWQ